MELTIALVIIGLLLSGILVPLSVQRENSRIAAARAQLSEARAALLGFAVVNGRLPCPAIPASAGQESLAGGGCTTQHGFLPAAALGLTGPRNGDSLQLDPWLNPLRYSVTNSDVDGDGSWDFTAPGELADVGVALLAPDLVVCSSAAGSTPTACSGAATTVTTVAPLMVYSMGKDWANFTSADQLENVGASLGGGPAGTSYRVASDVVFVDRGFSARSGAEYDDIVEWIPPGALYLQLLTAGRLP